MTRFKIFSKRRQRSTIVPKEGRKFSVWIFESTMVGREPNNCIEKGLITQCEIDEFRVDEICRVEFEEVMEKGDMILVVLEEISQITFEMRPTT